MTTEQATLNAGSADPKPVEQPWACQYVDGDVAARSFGEPDIRGRGPPSHLDSDTGRCSEEAVVKVGGVLCCRFHARDDWLRDAGVLTED